MDASDKIPERIRKEAEAARRRRDRLEEEAEILLNMGFDLSELAVVEYLNPDGTEAHQVQPRSIGK